MKRAGKRKLTSIAAATASPVVTETQKKRRKVTPGTISTKNVKKNAPVQGPTTSGGSQTSMGDPSTGYACPICLESNRKNEMTSLKCFHAYHRTCISEWLTEDRRCPVCRQEVDLPLNACIPDEPPQNASSSAPSQNARSSAPSQNARSSAPSQIARSSAPSQIARSSAPSQNARSSALRRNARPLVNNQRRMVSRDLQVLPGVTIGRNTRLNNGAIDMMFNGGNFLTINNNGLDMRLNVGGFEVRLNKDGFMILNNR